jgi:hypothetical protein
MTPDNEDISADVESALEQLRSTPEESLDASAEDIGLRVAAKLDEQDEQRELAAIPGETRNIEQPASQRRDARTGRFTAGAPVAAAEAPAGADHPNATGAAPAGPLSAPTSWSAAAKREFSRLSPEVQSAISKREAEVSSGFKNLSQSTKDLESIIGPRRQSLSRYGFKTDGEVIRHMMNFSDWYERDPAGLVAHLMQSARLNPQHFGIAAQQPQMSPQEARDMEMARQQVAAFEARPPAHYEVARPIMRQLLERGEAVDMKDAYDRAMALVRSVTDGRGSVSRKIAATNASLSGAPHGVSSNGSKRNHAVGSFGDVADDVRAALGALNG